MMSQPQPCIRTADNQTEDPPPPQDPPPQTKVTIVVKNEIFKRESLIGLFLVHKLFAPPPPPLLSSNVSLPGPCGCPALPFVALARSRAVHDPHGGRCGMRPRHRDP